VKEDLLNTKVQIGALVFFFSTVAWGAVTQIRLSNEVGKLTDRIEQMEDQALMASSSRPAYNSARRGGGPMGPMGKRKGMKAAVDGQEMDVSSASGSLEGDSSSLTQLKEELRDELVEIAADEQEAAQEDRKQEWRNRIEDGMRQSIAEFVDEHQIDKSTAEQIQTLADDRWKDGMKLWEELEKEEISWYQLQKERKANREAFEADVAEMLTDEEFEAFMVIFPKRGR